MQYHVTNKFIFLGYLSFFIAASLAKLKTYIISGGYNSPVQHDMEQQKGVRNKYKF